MHLAILTGLDFSLGVFLFIPLHMYIGELIKLAVSTHLPKIVWFGH